MIGDSNVENQKLNGRVNGVMNYSKGYTVLPTHKVEHSKSGAAITVLNPLILHITGVGRKRA